MERFRTQLLIMPCANSLIHGAHAPLSSFKINWSPFLIRWPLFNWSMTHTQVVHETSWTWLKWLILFQGPPPKIACFPLQLRVKQFPTSFVTATLNLAFNTVGVSGNCGGNRLEHYVKLEISLGTSCGSRATRASS